MSTTPTEQSDRSDRRFARFVRRARRRAWTVLFLRSWLRAAAVCLVPVVAIHSISEVRPSAAAELGALASLVAATVLSLLRRRTIGDYIAVVDRHYDAAGRIVAATEFLRSHEPPDAFRKLAIEDAAEWIDKHPRRGLPWTLAQSRRPVPGAVPCIALALLIGCESPQPTTSQRRATDPDVAPPGLAERPQEQEPPSATTGGDQPQAESGQNGAVPGQGTAGTRSTSTATGPADARRPGERAGSAPAQPEDAAQGTAPAPLTEPIPEPPPESVPQREPGQEPEGQSDRPDAAQAPEDGPPGGQQAGTEEAEKRQDNREVDAPADDVQAPAADDEAPGVGPETEGIGEELTEGAAAPPQTQPVGPTDYRDARRQDLTRERVSPTRRALIERYFRNLRKSAPRSTSQPASQPSSRPARKAEHS